MTRDRIMMLLCSQDYPEFMLEQTADKIEHLTPQISSAFEEWEKFGTEPTIEFCGYTYTKLVENFGMKPIAAFLALDWLSREPEKASAALKRGIRKINIKNYA